MFAFPLLIFLIFLQTCDFLTISRSVWCHCWCASAHTTSKATKMTKAFEQTQQQYARHTIYTSDLTKPISNEWERHQRYIPSNLTRCNCTYVSVYTMSHNVTLWFEEDLTQWNNNHRGCTFWANWHRTVAVTACNPSPRLWDYWCFFEQSPDNNDVKSVHSCGAAAWDSWLAHIADTVRLDAARDSWDLAISIVKECKK